MSKVTCSKCGSSRPSELTSTTVRPPCPHCGATALAISVVMKGSISVSGHFNGEFVPGNQSRDWN